MDAVWIILLIAVLVLCLGANLNVRLTYSKYSKVENSRRMTGADVARSILDANGLSYVSVEHVSGSLTDHYDPKALTVSLSDDVFGGTSVAALGVAAHECGHAVQHAVGYTPVVIRSNLFPVVNFCSRAWYLVFVAGLVLARLELGWYLMIAAVLLFAAVTLFQLVTLPVEIDASRRAMRILKEDSYLFGPELTGARKVLTAAALTYVAALINSILQLMRLIAAANRRR